MQRLRDRASSSDPVAREMERLLSFAEKSDPAPVMASRIRARLAATGRRRPRLLAFRYVLAVALLFAMTAIGGAWIVHVTLRHRDELRQEPRLEHAKKPHGRSSNSTSPQELPAPAPPQAALPEVAMPPLAETRAPEVSRPPTHALVPREEPRTPVVPAGGAPPIVVTVQAPAPAAVVEPAPAVAAAPVVRAEPANDVPAAAKVMVPAPASVAPSTRAALVVSARVALHHDDPRAALRLVAQYLRENPDGPVVEEALALAIEARTAMGDRRGAAAAAQTYLSRFPAGRFAALADRTTSVAHP